jgi:hypothetical protein
MLPFAATVLRPLGRNMRLLFTTSWSTSHVKAFAIAYWYPALVAPMRSAGSLLRHRFLGLPRCIRKKKTKVVKPKNWGFRRYGTGACMHTAIADAETTTEITVSPASLAANASSCRDRSMSNTLKHSLMTIQNKTQQYTTN